MNTYLFTTYYNQGVPHKWRAIAEDEDAAIKLFFEDNPKAIDQKTGQIKGHVECHLEVIPEDEHSRDFGPKRFRYGDIAPHLHVTQPVGFTYTSSNIRVHTNLKGEFEKCFFVSNVGQEEEEEYEMKGVLSWRQAYQLLLLQTGE